MSSTPRKRIEVVAAVIYNRAGQFLLAQRPPGKAYAGYWEFPGGKVEPGESAQDALKRELHEELGIDVRAAYPWLTRDFDYAHAAVRLRFFAVREWFGALQGREGQQFIWQTVNTLTVSPILPANGPIMRALELPEVYGISNASVVGIERFLLQLDHALRHGLKLLQIREKNLPRPELAGLAKQAISLARSHDAKVLINTDIELACEAGADGVHLTAAQLTTLSARPRCDWVGASCHNAGEIARAVALGADFVVVGPVLPTPTHPDAATLGWDGFRKLAADCMLPVYALGGMERKDCEQAWRAGAHGVAMLRGAWEG